MVTVFMWKNKNGASVFVCGANFYCVYKWTPILHNFALIITSNITQNMEWEKDINWRWTKRNYPSLVLVRNICVCGYVAHSNWQIITGYGRRVCVSKCLSTGPSAAVCLPMYLHRIKGWLNMNTSVLWLQRRTMFADGRWPKNQETEQTRITKQQKCMKKIKKIYVQIYILHIAFRARSSSLSRIHIYRLLCKWKYILFIYMNHLLLIHFSILHH